MPPKGLTVITLAVSEEERSLLVPFQSRAPKGAFYTNVYRELNRYFQGEIEAPAENQSSVGKFKINLKFDVNDPFENGVRLNLFADGYSGEVKAIIKKVALEYCQQLTIAPPPEKKPEASKHKTKKKSKSARPQKAKAKMTAQSVQPKRQPNPAPNATAMAERTMEDLTFDASLSGDSRLKALSASISVSKADAERPTIMEYAQVFEKALQNGEVTECLERALADAEDTNLSFFPDYKRKCPYLKDLHFRAAQLVRCDAPDDEGSGEDAIQNEMATPAGSDRRVNQKLTNAFLGHMSGGE